MEDRQCKRREDGLSNRRIKETKNGGCMFNLKAGNGQVIWTSEIYNSDAACENGIASVMKNTPDAEIIECI